MEMLELNNANQTTVNSNGAAFYNQHQPNMAGGPPPPPPSSLQAQQHLNAAHLYRNQQQQQQQQQQQTQQGLRYVNNQKVSKHRELPVDVPDSFVGMAKQSPRYPPPKPHRQVSPPMPMNTNLTTFNHAPAAAMPYNSNGGSQTGATNQPPQQQQPTISPLSQNTAANIVTHNNSLRSSIKLKQLEKSRGGNAHGGYPVGHLQPAINQAFELNEDDATVPSTNASALNPQAANDYQNNVNSNQAKQSLKMQQSMSDLSAIYNRLQRNLNGEFTDVAGDAKFAKLLSIYNTIVQTHNKQFRIPNLTSRHATASNSQGNQELITYKVSDLLRSVAFMLRDQEMVTEDAYDLLSILAKHEVDGVCSAFDRIIQSFEFAKSSRPCSPNQPTDEYILDGNHHRTHQHQHPQQQQQPPMYNHKQQAPLHGSYPNHHQTDDYDYAPEQIQMDFESNLYQNSMHPLTDMNDMYCIKTVSLPRNHQRHLGATIKNDENGSVVVGRIVCGGEADRAKLLNEGDEIMEINGIPMHGKHVNEVVNILEQIDDELLTFKIKFKNYNKQTNRNPQEKTFVRAFFRYDAENDNFLPCKELGLSFETRDVLAIIDRSDEKWWQAHREGDSEWRLAGLIPSISFLKQQEKDLNQEDLATTNFKHEKKNLVSILFNCPKGTSPRRRKKSVNMPFSFGENPYYEDVELYYPNEYRKRPIILVGPKSIGIREIVSKLLDDLNRFASPTSHTSKPRQDHERTGIDFHFVTKAQFEAEAKAGKFIESGLYNNHYYGTSYEAMKEVVKSRKTCIHLLNTTSIFSFRQGPAGSELKPFFVFIKPDDSHEEKLRNLVSQFLPPKANLEDTIKAIKAEVQIIETHYLPYIDFVITISDVERAYQELLREIERIESEPQWIPMFWRDTPSNF